VAPTTTTATTTVAPPTTTIPPTTTAPPVPTQGAGISGNAQSSGSHIITPSLITLFCVMFIFLFGAQL
jgi:ABC-type Na+ efflux pump permease subunit